MDFSKVYQFLNSAKNILCITHTSPDLDGISSMLAFYQTFKDFPFQGNVLNEVKDASQWLGRRDKNELGMTEEGLNSREVRDEEKKNFILLLEDIPRKAYFLPGFKALTKVEDLSNRIHPELLIVFDAHCPKRINEKVLSSFNRPELAIIFDHHHREPCEPFAEEQIEIIDPSSPSTTALLFDFFTSTNTPLTQEVATLLLFGLYYDTGGFRYENVSARTFEMASRLTKLGASPSAVANAIYSNRTLGEINLLKSALNRMKLIKDGKVIITYLTKEDFELYGKELDDLASFFRDVEGVMLSVLIKELDYDHISVSLRSKPPFPSLPLAKEFGGGGHTYACGFRVRSRSLEEVIRLLKSKISQLEFGR